MKPVRPLAPDGRLLARTATRQLLHGAALASGQPLVILPTAMAQALKGVQSAQEGVAARALQSARMADDAKERCVRAAGRAARQWLEDELARPDSAYRAAALTLEQAWRARSIAAGLPGRAARPRSPAAAARDALLIGEAAVAEAVLVAERRRGGIDPDEVNAWAKASLGLAAPLMRPPDQAGREALQRAAPSERRRRRAVSDAMRRAAASPSP